jgi:hypothetical protein
VWVEQHIESLPSPYKEFAYELRSILLNLHPAMEESYKWSLPYYTLGKGFGYIHFDKKKKLYLGLMSGFQLIDDLKLLEGDGKLVRKYVIRKQADLYHPEFAALLQQAIAINLNAFSRKKR